MFIFWFGWLECLVYFCAQPCNGQAQHLCLVGGVEFPIGKSRKHHSGIAMSFPEKPSYQKQEARKSIEHRLIQASRSLNKWISPYKYSHAAISLCSTIRFLVFLRMRPNKFLTKSCFLFLLFAFSGSVPILRYIPGLSSFEVISESSRLPPRHLSACCPSSSQCF